MKFGLEKAQAMMEKKMTAGVRNMSFALSVKSGPYVSAGAKGFNALKSKLKLGRTFHCVADIFAVVTKTA